MEEKEEQAEKPQGTPADKEAPTEGKPQSGDKEKKKSKKKTVAIVLLALLLCASLAGLGYLAWQQFQPKSDAGATVTQFENMSREEIQAELDRQTEESRMTMSVSAQPILKDGKIRVNVINDEGNRFDQRFVLTQDDEVVASCEGNIEPGKSIEWADAAESAHAGEATISIQAYEKGTDTPFGNPQSATVNIVEDASQE